MEVGVFVLGFFTGLTFMALLVIGKDERKEATRPFLIEKDWQP